MAMWWPASMIMGQITMHEYGYNVMIRLTVTRSTPHSLTIISEDRLLFKPWFSVESWNGIYPKLTNGDTGNFLFTWTGSVCSACGAGMTLIRTYGRNSKTIFNMKIRCYKISNWLQLLAAVLDDFQIMSFWLCADTYPSQPGLSLRTGFYIMVTLL